MVSIRLLKEFNLFEELDDSKLAKIAELCYERTFDDSTLCFEQGKEATELYLCRSGQVDILVRLNEPWGIELKVHSVKAGEVFGWSALVKPYLYTASAKCVGRVEGVYAKGSDLMINLFKQNPEIGYVVMQNLSTTVSSRLTETRQKLVMGITAFL